MAYREGRARLVDGGVEVDGQRLSSERIIIATGARPALPDIPGIAEVAALDSTTALSLKELPRSMVVIGGGYTGAELAQTFARVGVAVTLVFRSRLLPEAEPEIGQALAAYLANEGISVVSGVTSESVRKTDDGGVMLAIIRNGRPDVLTAGRILVATGRTPNTEDLGLAEAEVAQTSSGAIVVDDRMRTSKTGVYAAGDVTGKDQFVYMAAYGAKLAARNALNGNSLRYDNGAMPAVVFTDPQVASVGLTEAQARGAGHAVRTSVLSLDNLPRARGPRYRGADQARRGRDNPQAAGRAYSRT
ncbi:NAD(P)/FAD-dependent oxidoreductase [Mesorhizobium sp. 10.2.3]|uniref:dihydrolipoyl dehydrogenase family protein n=1 Tax=Mesorhizobium sp. 10.2.3 TaxID=1085775 RepID=UPI002484C7D8|nr:NAD(P)/FAD-dependent oxidoreductase [Mesorhizobium sp. 10.2.3]